MENNDIERIPEIVCLCGSSRFVDRFAVKAWELEKQGIIALSIHLLPEWYGAEPHHNAEAEGVAGILDQLHLCKIVLADRVHVMNINGYVGESTKNEIRFAFQHGKEITFEEPDSEQEIIEEITKKI